jgi:serine/threonine protein kinase/WD40 repeat protein
MNTIFIEADPIDALAEAFLERVRRGDAPDIDECARDYPEHAERIRELFPALLAVERAGSLTFADAGERLPARLGEYRILREIGRGGMGVVYEALHESLGRHAALKILPRRSPADPMQLLRFRREARAAARPHHTSIVPVFEVGECDGVHFYAMQFIRGQALSAVLAELRRQRGGRSFDTAQTRSLPEPTTGLRIETAIDDTIPITASALFSDGAGSGPSQNQYYRNVARIGQQIADALAYAHTQRVLHRDIKPANLLLDADGAAWITDFGLAKEEGDDLTQTGDLVGTLRYMAPERFRGAVDARSDIYGLGLTLYEMLALRPAFDDSDRARLIQHVTHCEPSRLNVSDPLVPRDLETIVLKAIAKEPRDRYQTAKDLSDDLARFRADRPIRARRASSLEHAWRWARRKPVTAVFGLVALSLLVTVAVVSTVAAFAFNRQTQRAQSAERDTRLEVGKSLLAQGAANLRTGLRGQRFDSLDMFRRAAEVFRADPRGTDYLPSVRDHVIGAMSLTDLKPRWERPIGLIVNINADADLERCAIVDRGRRGVRIVRFEDGRELARLPSPGDKYSFAHCVFGPDGGSLAVEYFLTERPTHLLELWLLNSREKILAVERPTTNAFAFHPDGRRFVYQSAADELTVWDMIDRRAVGHLPLTSRPYAIAFDPSGKLLAINANSVDDKKDPQARLLRVIDFASGAEFAAWTSHVGSTELAWSGDGRLLASGTATGRVFVWEVNAQRLLSVLDGHASRITNCQFAASGGLLMTASWDGTMRLWDAVAGKCLLVARGGSGFISANGQRLATFESMRLAAYDLIHETECRTVNLGARHWDQDPNGGGISFSRFSPDGRLLAVGSQFGLYLVDVHTGGVVTAFEAVNCDAVDFHPDGRSFVEFDRDHGLRRWPIEDEPAAGLPLGTPTTIMKKRLGTYGVGTWIPGGAVYAIADWRGKCVRLFDLSGPDAKPIAELPDQYQRISNLAASPDGRWLAAGGWGVSGIQIWDLTTRKPLEKLLIPGEGAGGRRFRVAFSPDGSRLVVSSFTDEFSGCYQFAVGSWERTPFFPTPELNFPCTPLFSPDRSLLAVSVSRSQVRLADPVTGRALAHITLQQPLDPVPLAFSPDGRQLVLATNQGAIQIWDLHAVRQNLTAQNLHW